MKKRSRRPASAADDVASSLAILISAGTPAARLHPINRVTSLVRRHLAFAGGGFVRSIPIANAAESLDREAAKTDRLIWEGMWIRKSNCVNRDEGSYQLSHVRDRLILPTGARNRKSVPINTADRRSKHRRCKYYGCVITTRWHPIANAVRTALVRFSRLTRSSR